MHRLAQCRTVSGSSVRVITFAILKNLAIFSLLFAAATLPAFAQQVTACGSGSISIPNFGPAAPYPYPISVSGLTGNVSKLTVSITGFNHTFPGDVDMLLVSPDGTRKMMIWSDVGGSLDAVNLDITLDDAAASAMPINPGQLFSGSYRPTDAGGGAGFPAPAPAPSGPYSEPAPDGAATFASVFNGMTPAQANGVWNLYIVDVIGGDAGSISGGVCLNITQASASPGDLIISEFRLRGPNGANDEFIEIYNASGANHTVAATSGSGYGVAASDGTTRCSIPNGTVIPSRGHYLCVNSNAYSLASYPAGNGTTTTGDATYTTDIPDNAGIALFNNNVGGASYSIANVLDAVGSTGEANTLYKEGTGYPAISVPPTLQYSFYRDLSSGQPKDTDNNAADFLYVDTFGLATAAGTHLGAPGPENLSSPIQRNGWLTPSLIDPTVAASLAPNRVRDQTPVTNGGYGTIDIRRRYINNTGAPVTRLRFRIVEMTTYYTAGMADLRAITSNPVPVTVNSAATCAPGATPCTITVEGTTLEHPAGPNFGGGLNSTLSANTVNLATPLANGESINVRWLLGVAAKGNFSFFVNVELLP